MHPQPRADKKFPERALAGPQQQGSRFPKDVVRKLPDAHYLSIGWWRHLGVVLRWYLVMLLNHMIGHRQYADAARLGHVEGSN